MKIKKKILLMNIGILIAAICCFVFIVFAGDEYTVHTRYYMTDSQLVDVIPKYTNDGIVELESYELSDESELLLNMKSLSQGSTGANFKITLILSDGERTNNELYTEFNVGLMGIIFENHYGLNFSGFQAVIITLLAVFLMIEAVMVWMFEDYRRRGCFCYPMIACGGLAIFILILLLFGVYKILNNAVFSFSAFVSVISDIGSILLVTLSPAMLILAVLLAFSNIWLIRHEGFRPVNTLGIIFAILWVAGTILTLFPSIIPNLETLPYYYVIRRILTYIICYFECMFIATAASSYLATKYKPDPDRDYIIILGCAIRSDGSPTPLLKARVDAAREFAEQQLEKTGKKAVFVPSGGQGSDEVISESESMENYLLSLGVPQEQILREDKSVNTMQNMQFSKEVIENDTDDFPSKRIAFATTNYHVFRGYILAGKNSFDAKGISAKTKPYFYPNAFLREFIGLLVDQKFKHLFFIAITLLVFLTVFR